MPDREAHVKTESATEGHPIFVVQDADTCVSLPAKAQRPAEGGDPPLRPVLEERTGRYPEGDSPADDLRQARCEPTSEDSLHHAPSLAGAEAEAEQIPSSAWRRIELKGVSRQYKHRISINGPFCRLRRSRATGDRHRLGHEEPTILTNQPTPTAANPGGGTRSG